MAENKLKKIDAGRVLLESYQNKKHHEAHGKVGDFYSSLAESSCKEAQVFGATNKSEEDTDKVKMDAVTLQRKTAEFTSLTTTIKKLQDSLSEKNEIIDSLEVKIRILQEGAGDHCNISPGGKDDKNMIKELKAMVDARETYILQLSESLQKQSDELETALQKEKELSSDIQALQQEINNRRIQNDSKINDAYLETIEYKAKVELLTKQVEGYSSLLKEKQESQEELIVKIRKLEKCKSEASEHIKELMKHMEFLNCEVSKKEKELKDGRIEVENIRSSLKEQWSNELIATKNEMEEKYKEEIRKVETYYDGLLLDQIRKSSAEINSIDLESEISSCKIFYEKEINTYKEDLEQMLEKNKIKEEQLLRELEKCKLEADHYKQQVENIENKLSEEVQKVKQDCHSELDSIEADMNVFKTSCIEEKARFLKEYTIKEGKREVELETYRDELKKNHNTITSLDENLKKYKDSYEKQQKRVKLLETDINNYKELNTQLKSRVHEFQSRENQLLHELKTYKAKLHDYENQVFEFNEKIKLESQQFSEKYNDVVQTFNQQIQNLTSQLENNKALYEKDILHWTSQANIQQNEIKALEAKLTHFLGANKEYNTDIASTEESNIDSTHDQTGQLRILKQNMMLVEKMRETNKGDLLTVLHGLREIKAYIQNLLQSNEENVCEDRSNGQLEENIEHFSHEVFTKEVEKTVCDLLTFAHSVQFGDDGNISFDTTKTCMPTNMMTSTPNVKGYYDFEYNAIDKNLSLDIDGNTSSVNNIIISWKGKCEALEEENMRLTKDVEMLTANMKEMEYCFTVAFQESISFNKKCQILDAKISEIEKSKLSEYLLKKENNELKEQFRCMEENENSFQRDLKLLNEKNIELEQTFNKNLINLQNKLSKSGPNLELERILEDLNGKSEEVICLKSQLAYLQNVEKEQKLKIQQLQSNNNNFNTHYEFLMAELNAKRKELDDLWKERNKISIDNKMLQTKLVAMQEKSTRILQEQNAISNNEDIGKDVEKDNASYPRKRSGLVLNHENQDDFSFNRLKAMHLLTVAHDLAHSVDSTASNLSVVDQINYQLQLLEQQTEGQLDYHMPTIPEEEDHEEILHQQEVVLRNQVKTGLTGRLTLRVSQCGGIVQFRSGLALKQLLSVLFDEYTRHIRKLLLPWKDELHTLDYNLQKDLDKGRNKTDVESKKETQLVVAKKCVINKESSKDADSTLLSLDFLNSISEDCVKSLFYLKKRLDTAHNAVLSSINVKKEELEKACVLVALKEQVESLQAEKTDLEKTHKSAVELLIKDHENELGLVNSLLAEVQKSDPVRIDTEDSSAIVKDLELRHKKEVEELRTYFEMKCADLEKHYCEEIYSHSQQSCKVSASSSSSDIENMADMYYPGQTEDEEHNPMRNEDNTHDGCEKRLSDLKELMKNMQGKYNEELESVRSDYEVQLRECICKLCGKNTLMNGNEPKNKKSGITLEQYYTEKIEEFGKKYCSSNISKDLELTVYQIKEEVRKDYENELDKIREEIIAMELKRKDKEIAFIRNQLNEAHKIEVEKLWSQYEELAKKEVENSAIRVKNEVSLTQELEDKTKLIEQLKNEKKELLRKQQTLNEKKQKEIEQLKIDWNKAHEKEKENIKQAYEIEVKIKMETVLEEKAEAEELLNKKIEEMQEIINSLNFEKQNLLDCHKREMQNQKDSISRDIFRTLELQIKEMVESGDEGEDMSHWPPELAALERQFTSKYQQQLAQLVEEHALELADIKAEYDAKLCEIIKEYSIKQAEDMQSGLISTGDHDIDKIIRERDNLRNLSLTLRQVVQQLAHYLTSCEDELNKSIVGELLKLVCSQNGHKVQISTVEEKNSDSDSEVELKSQKKVHFAPDVTNIVTLMDEDYLFECLENSVDVSVHFRSELESCLERLRSEAAELLGHTQVRERALPSTVEDRRLTSLTRQVIEEKKAKEEANSQLRNLQDQILQYEKELNDVHKELTETKEKMIKQKVAVETEFAEVQCERRIQNLCLLQEKARSLLNDKGDCPPPWMRLIEELCVEGDFLIEEAWKARDELQLEVEAADKQLRSTRAFLEEQATEREQERDEFTKEITRLTELLRERDRDWTSQKNFATEVEALEQQVKETTELLKQTEQKKVKVENELKAAVDKIWVLRDIISELEVQVSNRCEREVSLEQRLAELEAELDSQARGQVDMLQELQALRDHGGGDQDLQREVNSLQDQLRKQGTPIVRQMKSQLRGMARSLDRQIKELEAVNIHVSSASLSSPSEDVSIREQLEGLRCSTPEEKTVSPPSPLSIDEVNQLSDRLLRYSRAAENIIKKLRDKDIEISMLREQTEELQTERDFLQGENEKKLMQLASLRNSVEELRIRSDRDTQAGLAPLHQRILDLEKHNSDLSEQLKDSHRKLNQMKQKLERSEALLVSKEAEISSLSEYQQELVQKLSEDLATMRTEKQQLQAVVEKYRSEDSVSFPQLIEVMLAEKNADIDQLQQRVEELQYQQEHKSQSKTRGHRVSFADDVSHSSLAEGERTRGAQSHVTSMKPHFSTPLSSIEEAGSSMVPRVIGEDISKIAEPSIVATFGSSPTRAGQLESVLLQLKSELEEKNRKLEECEAQLVELPLLEQELTKAKEELVKTVMAVGEDKRFYEEQLKSLGQTQQLLLVRESELREVREELTRKQEDVVKTTEDNKKLQTIMGELRQRLEEVKQFTEKREERSDQKQKMNKYKADCNAYRIRINSLENQLKELSTNLGDERAAHITMKETVEKIEKDKQNILSELLRSKNKCKSLQEKLEAAAGKANESCDKIKSLSADLEAATTENKSLDAIRQRLQNELECLSKKHKTDLENILRKDSEEANKLKEEIERLRSANSELHLACEKLQRELNEVGSSWDLLKELNDKDDKIQQLQSELNRLDTSYNKFKSEKLKTEQSLNVEISGLKMLTDDLNKNILSLETETKESHDKTDEKEHKELCRKYDILKREYDRQRRARRESEKKCTVLKDELAKEKRFSVGLQNRSAEQQEPTLVIAKAHMIDIRPEEAKPANSSDNLTDEVEQELAVSAQLDQSLISGSQSPRNIEFVVSRSDSMPQRVDYLTGRLAEVEMALHVEQVVVNELRGLLTEERTRYLEQRARAHELSKEVATLHTLNDQIEDKFRTTVYHLEQQVNEVKILRQNMEPAHEVLKEKERLGKLLDEYKKKLDKQQQEKVISQNQLLYMREELAKLQYEKEGAQSHAHGDNNNSEVVDNLQQALESRNRELEQMQRKYLTLQRMLEAANQRSEESTQLDQLHNQIGDLKRELDEETRLRKSLETKIKTMESAERSRHARRKASEEKLKETAAQAEKAKKELERECLALQLKLKQSHLRLKAQTAESPLSLRLKEANMAVERLVGEKESWISANALLKEEKVELERRLKQLDAYIDDLKTQIHVLNIKVTDGGVDNLNAMFAAERAAWLKEKEKLKQALVQTYSLRTDSFNGYNNSEHILHRYLRAESHRKSLIWQKRYLTVKLQGYEKQEKLTVAALQRFPATPPPTPPSTSEHKFKVAVHAVRAVFRLQFLVEKRRRTHENTCRILHHALNNGNILPRRDENIPELQNLWRNANIMSSRSSPQPPGSLSQYVDHFNTIQDRIKNTLSSSS